MQYAQMQHPELHIIPRTMCQDDVKIISPYKEQEYQEENQPLYRFLSHVHLLKRNSF